jgi:Ca-activated chloride channel family protein
MDFLWPDFLLLLGLIPLIITLYIWILQRRCRFAVRYSSLTLVQEAILAPSPLRRHLPFLLLIVALTSLVIAAARPVTVESILAGRTTIILTLDISTSMCMRDILPNRLEVARAAALSFVQYPVLGTQVGVVAFAGFAELAQEPTTDLNRLENTIVNLTTTTGTAIGSAIFRSLDAIAEVDERVAPSEEIDRPSGTSLELRPQPKSSKGDYVPHIIVLLTDGASNTGPPPLHAAQQAAARGVRIYPIGFGTTKNAIMDCWNIADNSLSADPGFESQTGGGFGSVPDEATLKQIADMTGGKFYSATSAAELQLVFKNLHHSIALANKTVEVSVFFIAIGVAMAMAAVVLSLLLHPLL